MTTMLILLALVSALATVRADCDACVQGICHSKKILIQGFHVTDQIAIDRTDNILYAQLDYRTTAIFLDEAKIRIVHTENTTGLAVDQDTQILYSSLDGVIYAHVYQSGGYTTDAAYELDRPTTPVKLRYDNNLYIINKDGSSAYFSKISKSFAGYDNLEHFAVTDLANHRNITHWFFVSENKLYKYIYDGGMSWRLISDKNHVLSTGKYGDIYFGEASEKIIYKLDRETGELVKYADYKEGSVEDFVFDRDENIVFRDADGSVVQWKPNGEECITANLVSENIADWQSNESSEYYRKGFYVVELLQNRMNRRYIYQPDVDYEPIASLEMINEEESDIKLNSNDDRYEWSV